MVTYGRSLISCFYRSHGRHLLPDALDPRVLYNQDTHQAINILRREYGCSVRKIPPLIPSEQRSGYRFVDHFQYRGWMQAAIFNLFNTSGGRRPRALASLQLKDVQIVVEALEGGSSSKAVHVPSLRLVWRDVSRQLPNLCSHMTSYPSPVTILRRK
jgi:hypothetical protein